MSNWPWTIEISRIAIVIVLIMLGCDSRQEQPSNQASGGGRQRWTTIGKNEWYELSEFRAKVDESVVYCDFAKTDPQLGIGLAIDLAVLADSRGFTHFRRTEADPAEKYPQVLADINSDKRQSDLFIVHFYHAKPDGHTDVFEVKSLMGLADRKQ